MYRKRDDTYIPIREESIHGLFRFKCNNEMINPL